MLGGLIPAMRPSAFSIGSGFSSFSFVFLALSLVSGCRRAQAGSGLDGGASSTSAPVASIETATAPPAPTGAGTAAPAGSTLVVQGPLSFAPVARSANPSVVTISTTGEPEVRGPFARGGGGRVSRGLGTGFVIAKDGTIVTNNHVVEGAESIVVQLEGERRLPAHVLGRDPRTDIAVLKIADDKELPAIALGDSDALDVGDWVVAIGNPFGLSHTVSAGIVSAKGRGREDVPLDPSGYYDFIQTDASINPGNSGGPLLNLKGEVVGMNTAIRGGGAQGIGFAIPINMVKQIVPALIRDGHLVRSAMGVRIRDVRDVPESDRVRLKIGDEKGAVIDGVEPGGPAEKAKLEVGDLITAFDGQSTDKSSLLQWKASTAGVGKTVPVRIVRGGKTMEVSVTLGTLKEPRAARAPRVVAAPSDDPGYGTARPGDPGF